MIRTTILVSLAACIIASATSPVQAEIKTEELQAQRQDGMTWFRVRLAEPRESHSAPDQRVGRGLQPTFNAPMLLSAPIWATPCPAACTALG